MTAYFCYKLKMAGSQLHTQFAESYARWRFHLPLNIPERWVSFWPLLKRLLQPLPGCLHGLRRRRHLRLGVLSSWPTWFPRSPKTPACLATTRTIQDRPAWPIPPHNRWECLGTTCKLFGTWNTGQQTHVLMKRRSRKVGWMVTVSVVPYFFVLVYCCLLLAILNVVIIATR